MYVCVSHIVDVTILKYSITYCNVVDIRKRDGVQYMLLEIRILIFVRRGFKTFHDEKFHFIYGYTGIIRIYYKLGGEKYPHHRKTNTHVPRFAQNRK